MAADPSYLRTMGVWERYESRAWVVGVRLWAAALCPALTLAACGGRTTLLEGDPNDVSTGSAVPSAGTSSSGGASGSSTPSTGVPGGGAAPSTGVAVGIAAGGISAGGTVGVGFAGSPSIAGSPGTAPGVPGVASPACVEFCKGATSPPCLLDAEPFDQCLTRCEAQKFRSRVPTGHSRGRSQLSCSAAASGDEMRRADPGVPAVPLRWRTGSGASPRTCPAPRAHPAAGAAAATATQLHGLGWGQPYSVHSERAVPERRRLRRSMPHKDADTECLLVREQSHDVRLRLERKRRFLLL
jgi:hypothetical protein